MSVKGASLIDCAARALAAHLDAGQDWDTLDAARQDHFRTGLRKALEAIRDPDERMNEAGAEIVRNVGPSESPEAYLNDTANIWRYMIDALLGEKD